MRVRWRRIPPTRSRATAWPVRPVAPPCRRDGGPVGDVAVPGFPGPRVAALAPASRRLRCPFSIGYWQVSAQIYLGCTFGGPSIDLGWRLQWSPRAGLQLAARRRPAAGGSVRCRRLARVGPVPGAPRVPRRQARLGARGQGTDGPGASRARGPASDYASGPVLFHPSESMSLTRICGTLSAFSSLSIRSAWLLWAARMSRRCARDAPT